jgi:hypothetical protein
VFGTLELFKLLLDYVLRVLLWHFVSVHTHLFACSVLYRDTRCYNDIHEVTCPRFRHGGV